MIKSITFATLLVVFIGAPLQAAKPIGELALSAGIMFPQGSYSDFSSHGAHVMVRADMHYRPTPVIAAVANAGFAVLEGDRPVTVIFDGSPTRAYLSKTAVALHVGLQIGTTSRRAMLRFRGAVLSGLYAVNYSWQQRTAFQETLEASETKIRFGWRLEAGMDIFITKGLGICADFLWDQINSLQSGFKQDQSGNWSETTSPVRIHTYMLGVVIPFEKLGK
jgi:hypothetical protein